ncbi:hypothetical protein F3Y22_tig00110450pilonHSYRG01155 [Hibiscus syriacus]|uniref:RNase H type-1 domain-containing protein n=1 Tax=Hibiscus syriacus TaxID=106335 RepID=A0A6A3AKT9_HIBSY|nr:hypothetical protein F3Y22_tig00110450pilonHSYRG01155 [Hibiscus syriacus]
MYNSSPISVLEAELWGVLDGLLLAWDCGLREVIVELDSRDAWRLLQQGAAMERVSSLVPHLVECMARSWRLQFVHVVREGNQAADHMAKLAWGWQYGLKVFATPPTEVLAIMQDDCQVRLSFGASPFIQKKK